MLRYHNKLRAFKLAAPTTKSKTKKEEAVERVESTTDPDQLYDRIEQIISYIREDKTPGGVKHQADQIYAIIEESKAITQELIKEQGRADRAQQDMLHIIEGSKLSDDELIEAAQIIKAIRKERREIKNKQISIKKLTTSYNRLKAAADLLSTNSRDTGSTIDSTSNIDHIIEVQNKAAVELLRVVQSYRDTKEKLNKPPVYKVKELKGIYSNIGTK